MKQLTKKQQRKLLKFTRQLDKWCIGFLQMIDDQLEEIHQSYLKFDKKLDKLDEIIKSFNE